MFHSVFVASQRPIKKVTKVTKSYQKLPNASNYFKLIFSVALEKRMKEKVKLR